MVCQLSIVRGIVNRKHDIRLGKAGIQAVLEHGGGAHDAFLGGLADKNERAMPAVFVLRQQRRGPDRDGHVQIVSARVHDGDFNPLIRAGRDMAGVGESRFLQNWERIKFGANHHGGAGAVLENGYNTGSTHIGRDLKTELAKLVAHLGGGLLFMQREFWISVQVFVESPDRRLKSI